MEHYVTVAICPICKAIVVEGHDPDGQVFCAKCSNSFLPKSTVLMADSDFKKMKEQATTTYTQSGWEAYDVPGVDKIN